MSLTDLVQTSLSVSGPTFGWVFLGVLLRRAGLLHQRLIDFISRTAFNIGIPLLLFTGAVAVDYSQIEHARYLLAGVLTTLAVLLLAACYARWRKLSLPQTGVFVQAAFRSNLAIVGIALCHAAYGKYGVVLAALPVAVMTTLYNVLAVIVLNTTHSSSRSLGQLILGVFRNPLIIGIVCGAGVALSGVSVPDLVPAVGGAISTYFMPLVLVAIGGSINIRQLRHSGTLAWEATLWRLCIAPFVGVLLALTMGVRGEVLGVLFLLLSAPVAAASFVMVVAVRGDGNLAANIIVLSTLLSCLTVTVGFGVLAALGLIGLS